MKLLKRIAPWILLAAYLPLLTVMSLHTHHDVGAAVQECPDCAHHVSHAGHLSVATSVDHVCVLCQVVSSLHYFAPQNGCVFAVEQCKTVEVLQVADVVAEEHLYSRLRAPPICC